MDGMDGEGAHSNAAGDGEALATVKVEPYNGSYECFICNHSVRPQLKHMLAVANGAGGNDVAHEANLVLKCPMCTGEVYHAECGGVEFRTLCSTCGQETVQQWRPWGPLQGGIAVGQVVPVPDDVTDDETDEGTCGTPEVPAACSKSPFLPFRKALLYARSLKLKGTREWETWCKSGVRKANMPSNPHTTYKHNGWQGYGHWLGTGNVAGGNGQQFLPFKKALVYARSLKLKTMKEWKAWSKTDVRPANVPTHPEGTYKHDGWQGMGHWLGTGAVARHKQRFLPFKMALLHARSLKLESKAGWEGWAKTGERAVTMPSNPQATYRNDGWQGWGHWLGTGNQVGGGTGPKHHQFLPFKKALLYARSLNLKSKEQWEAWRMTGARPANIPSAPHKVYKHDGWQGWGHWLGTGNVAPQDHQFLLFKKALLYARSLKLMTKTEWHAWSKTGARPANMPSAPDRTYKHEGWQGYGHWLGTGNAGV